MRVLVLLAYNVLRLLTWPLWALWSARRRSGWVLVRVRGPLEELPRPQSRWRRLLVPELRPACRSVAELRALCERVAADPRARGLVVDLAELSGGYPTLGSLAAELARLRAAGKAVVCFLPEGADQRVLYAASAAERVLAMPHAGFSALGPLAARTYVAPLLARLGVSVEVTAEGRFKTAAEPLVRDAMSDPERAQLTALVSALRRDWVEHVGARPKLGRDGAEALLREGLFGAPRAAELGAIDATGYEDELRGELGLGPHGAPVPASRYRGGAPRPLFVPLRRRARVALIRLSGPIGQGPRATGIELRATLALLRRVQQDARVAGVLLHVDSPGGSALASELIHRAVQQLAAHKPTVAWLGDVAASGGYYIACAAPVVVAHPATLTGSIGVISVRPIAERLLVRLGVRREAVGVTPFADLESLTRAPTEDEAALLRAETRRYYARFLDVVAEGRRRPRTEIEPLAEGRVWAGRDAAAVGLVDALGGYREARAQVASLLGPRAARVDDTPLVLAPPRVAGSLPFPPAEGALLACRSIDLGALGELLGVVARGERVLAYALDLPAIR